MGVCTYFASSLPQTCLITHVVLIGHVLMLNVCHVNCTPTTIRDLPTIKVSKELL